VNITLENLSYAYRPFGATCVEVLRNIDLNISAGEFVGLVGASGAGKTTLMLHLNGLLKPDNGRVLVDGQDIHAGKQALHDVRQKVGLVFQFPETQLFEETVFADVAFGPKNIGVSEPALQRVVHQALNDVGLPPDEFADRSPLQLSFGEKRKAALAGILAMQPQFLALDEPTAGLDYAGTRALTAILQKLHAQGKSVLLISHNLDLVDRLAQRIVVLHRGEIAFDGDSHRLFADAALLRELRLARPRVRSLAAFLHDRGLCRSAELRSVEEIEQELKKYFQHNSVAK